MSKIDFSRLAASLNPETLVPDWLPDGRRNGREWVARNPTRADKNPGSFSINLDNGSWSDFATGDAGGDLTSLWAYLHHGGDNAAAARDLAQRYGIDAVQPSKKELTRDRKPEAVYPYHDETGALRYEVQRFAMRDADGIVRGKTFRQRRPDPDRQGKWIYSIAGVERLPYRLPSVLARPDEVVFVCEGEKAADAVASMGLVATTNSEGAGKWSASLSRWFAGRHVVIIPDNDEPGTEHARKVAAHLTAAGVEVRIAELPDLPPKGDAAEWVAQGGTKEGLLRLAEAAPVWAPLGAIDALGDDLPDGVVLQGELSEDALADVFERRHAGRLRFCHTAGAWFEWDGSRWHRDETRRAFHFAREVCRDFARAEVKFHKATVAGAVEKFAQSAPSLAVTGEVWDNDAWLLGTPGGTVDLRTGKLSPARQDDHITRNVAVTPAEAGQEPTAWLRFLMDATRGDKALIRFLQQVAGYCLTGSTREHALFFIYGGGGNGKSVFLNTLTGILAEYGTTAAMATFAASRNERHETELAMLKGARLVTASETEEGRAWAEAKIKQMTGGDPITARFMRRDFFTFQPEFKLLIVGNHKPRLHNVDDATKRRFNIIPFTNRPTEPDPDLELKLRDEFPAILRWMIEGALDWQENGLIRPEVVIEATREYFEQQDMFGQWLEDCCDIGPEHEDSNARLFSSWKDFSEANGERAGSVKAFSEAMRKRDFTPYRKHAGRGFVGIRVSPPMATNDPRDPGAWDYEPAF